MKQHDFFKNIVFWIFIIIGLLLVFSNILNKIEPSCNIQYSNFIQNLEQGKIVSVNIAGKTVYGITENGSKFKTYLPIIDNNIINKILEYNTEISVQAPEKPNLWLAFLFNWFPILFISGIFIFLMMKLGSGKNGAFSFGKSKAKLMNKEDIKITFEDVAGVDEAKEEVLEVVDFLKNPIKYKAIGARIPKGILMIGPPGTGKTLLAKAIAGEAKVPFFSISGSDFVEMFVGVGASRVRDMFEQAKKSSPCIVFIDEIDAVGRHRGSGLNGGHDEREQTLNQMLVEMDGFSENTGVIVIAATNRPDVLDSALLRPGRFDRQVNVALPSLIGRKAILNVHIKKIKMANNVNIDILARGTPGFSGAELANLINEAAIISAKNNQKFVEMKNFEKAKDKMLLGLEHKSLAMTNQQKKLIAYHEAGHALVGKLLPNHDPVYKISIIPRGRSLGVTMYLPKDEQFNQTREQLSSKLSSIFGGRIAEELIFGYRNVTTGAANDIEIATNIARNMVTTWGLSDKLGPILFDNNKNSKKFSDRTALDIDKEMYKIINKNYKRAEKILNDNIHILHDLANLLIQDETIDGEKLDFLIEQHKKTKK